MVGGGLEAGGGGLVDALDVFLGVRGNLAIIPSSEGVKIYSVSFC